MQQPVHVNGAVRHPAHARVTGEVLDLVQVQGPRDQSLQRTAADAADECRDAVGGGRDPDGAHRRPELRVLEVARGHRFVGREPSLLQRM